MILGFWTKILPPSTHIKSKFSAKHIRLYICRRPNATNILYTTAPDLLWVQQTVVVSNIQRSKEQRIATLKERYHNALHNVHTPISGKVNFEENKRRKTKSKNLTRRSCFGFFPSSSPQRYQVGVWAFVFNESASWRENCDAKLLSRAEFLQDI